MIIARPRSWDASLGVNERAHVVQHRTLATGGPVRLLALASTGAMMLLALLICSCVPTTTDTVPLQQASLAPPQSESISSAGYRLEALPIGEKAPDLLVLVAMSGGGKRSAAYSYGALKGMREVAVSGRPRSLIRC